MRLICESLWYIYVLNFGVVLSPVKSLKSIGSKSAKFVVASYSIVTLTYSLSHSDGQHGSLCLRGGKLQKCFTITINDIVAFRIPQSCQMHLRNRFSKEVDF